MYKIIKTDGIDLRSTVATNVADFEAARAFLAQWGEIIAFDIDADHDAADAAVKRNALTLELYVVEPEARRTVHHFESSGDAYDACQCDERIKTGDTLVIKDTAYRGKCTGRDEDGFRTYEHADKPISVVIVGLAWAWPLAVTVEAGELHTIASDAGAFAEILRDSKIDYHQVRAAVAKAKELGAAVRPEFDTPPAPVDPTPTKPVAPKVTLHTQVALFDGHHGQADFASLTPSWTGELNDFWRDNQDAFPTWGHVLQHIVTPLNADAIVHFGGGAGAQFTMVRADLVALAKLKAERAAGLAAIAATGGFPDDHEAPAGWAEAERDLEALREEADALVTIAKTMPVPSTLNGYPVVQSEQHKNCWTVMVARDDNLPYAVATWWPALGSSWSWGHYCEDRPEADREFRAAAGRNAGR